MSRIKLTISAVAAATAVAALLAAAPYPEPRLAAEPGPAAPGLTASAVTNEIAVPGDSGEQPTAADVEIE
jgi:hypothetical protein